MSNTIELDANGIPVHTPAKAPMTGLEMSASDQAELARYLAVDSADLPTSMAVNQEQIASDNSVEETPLPRSKYFGVYNNTGKNADKFKFRAAVRVGSNSNKYYVNLGYFNCEHTAALAYNTAAVNKFNSGAWLNPVDVALCDADELARFKKKRAGYITTAVAKIAAMHEAGTHINYVDLDRDLAPAHAEG